ncbi:hypothetical protein PUN28_020011 [Cardiocondyla obscurior]|uniref:Uncharacterized protein n=1 Tax=Cardiocondyla obscurior TaxID=286306 RepID=A0AAW2E8T1_9HYME
MTRRKKIRQGRRKPLPPDEFAGQYHESLGTPDLGSGDLPSWTSSGGCYLGRSHSSRPPRAALLPGDVWTYRLTSPRYSVPTTPRPIPVHQGTQTEKPKHEIQHVPPTAESGTQTDLWATTSASDSEPIIYPGDERWGLIRVTLTASHICYRERRV